jgi:hypothetical protein
MEPSPSTHTALSDLDPSILSQYLTPSELHLAPDPPNGEPYDKGYVVQIWQAAMQIMYDPGVETLNHKKVDARRALVGMTEVVRRYVQEHSPPAAVEGDFVWDDGSSEEPYSGGEEVDDEGDGDYDGVEERAEKERKAREEAERAWEGMEEELALSEGYGSFGGQGRGRGVLREGKTVVGGRRGSSSESRRTLRVVNAEGVDPYDADDEGSEDMDQADDPLPTHKPGKSDGSPPDNLLAPEMTPSKLHATIALRLREGIATLTPSSDDRIFPRDTEASQYPAGDPATSLQGSLGRYWSRHQAAHSNDRLRTVRHGPVEIVEPEHGQIQEAKAAVWSDSGPERHTVSEPMGGDGRDEREEMQRT